MSSTGTKRSRNRGTANCSTNPISRKNSGGKTVKISKYFTKEDSGSSDLSDSPYKNCLNDVKSAKLNTSASDLDDFKTPKAINKVSKLSQAKPSRKRKKTTQPKLRKFVEDNFKHEDVNPDHLQMALALSESSYQVENPGQLPSSQEKMDSFRKALEKYGFGYSKSRVPVELKREPDTKKRKNSKYRFVTPILKIRTVEDRESLISSKVSSILAQNMQKSVGNTAHEDYELSSASLRKYAQSKIHQLNCLDLTQLNAEGVFYVRGLDIEVSHASCGSLLKDWRRIPGRDVTPERAIKSSSKIMPPVQGANKSPQMVSPILGNCNTSLNLEASGERETVIFPIEIVEYSTINSPPSLQNGGTTSSPILESRYSFEEYSPSQGANKSSQATDRLKIISPSLEDGNNVTSRRSGGLTLSRKPSKYRLSPEPETGGHLESLESPPLIKSPVRLVTPRTTFDPSTSIDLDSLDATIIITPPKYIPPPEEVSPRSSKHSRKYLSPDLFGSDDDYQPLHNSPTKSVANCSKFSNAAEEMECFDLTQSDEEEKSFYLDLSRPDDSLNQKSDLNITDYVKNLLQTNDEIKPPSPPSGRKLEKISTSEDDSQLSQQSQSSVCISDDELNYSSVFSRTPPKMEEAVYVVSDDEYYIDPKELPLEQRINAKSAPEPVNKTPTLEDSLNDDLEQIPPIGTPDSSLIIKTNDVTPMPNYDKMDTPKIVTELDKFGLKPLKRQKGVKLLKYIYEATHPVVADGSGKIVKKRRIQLEHHQVGGGVILADLGEEEELVFERSQSKRVASCRAPLHVVWHNFVMSNPKIRESILLYEPLQLEVLHSMIKEQGFKFNVQDLLAFLDRKCVTIRTAQGAHRQSKKPKIP